MLLIEVVSVSQAVAATSARNAKIALLVEAIGRMDAEELAVGVSYLAGVVPQGAFGVGYAAVRNLPDPAPQPSLTLLTVDSALDRMAGLSGPGSSDARGNAIEELFALATYDEQSFLAALLVDGLRQGANEKLMMDAVAKAFAVPAALVRRAAMFSGDVAGVAAVARDGGRDGVSAIGLRLFRPVSPMLAKTAEGVDAGLEKLGEAAIERKLDGARIQVHVSSGQVRVYTRNFNDVTDRVPEIVAAVSAYAAESLVLDGEAIALRPDGRPHPFQVTMGRFGTAGDDQALKLSPFFFDVLHVDGRDVLDSPAEDRFRILERLVPAAHRVPRIVTTDAEVAADFMTDTLAAGHEGVVLKSLDASYEAGRRGAGWLKVKPVLTLDLVVLAVEWGSGRRSGWLSNIHLGARDPEGGFVMLGKTFKGMTDKMLEWQTERFSELETHRKGHVVYVRPEQVVEIAFDGVQASSRYPGGMALRFARVKGYRDDKPADEADTTETVREIFEGRSSG
jgi:DNA ligase-1